MNEATQPTTAPEALSEQAESPAPLAPFDFAAPEYHLTFPVRWPNREGRIAVTHKLRRPTLGEMMEWKKRTVFERQYDKTGAGVGESAETVAADHWLWDQLATSIGGYPGLNGSTLATPDVKRKMRSTHKEQAIDYMFAAEAEILEEESVASFDGGEWVVELRVGPNTDAPVGVVKFRFREWNERERRDYEKLSAISSTKTEGKKTTGRYGVNLKFYAELFDAMLLGAEGGVVDGKTFAEAGRDAFAREVNGEYKVVIVSQLARYWSARLQD